jgi:hypothetical protein
VTEQPETDEQRADRLETEREHAAGNHQYCGVTCEVEMPSDMLRNFIVAKGYPGTAGALDELLRRARERAEQAESAMERVRTLADRWDNALAPDQRYARTLRAALDQPKQPGCEHCGASASHLPTTYMKGGTVGYCHGELTTEQQPTTTEADQ